MDEVMPRVPEVFEEKTSWRTSFTDEVLQDKWAKNYSSAEESAEDVERQVWEEVAAGTIVKMSEEEAARRFKGRLAVAALGAVPKELNSKKVRVTHDGTYSVDVNRRIKVRDRLRFPLVDDAEAVLVEARAEVKRQKGGARLSLLYDVARAHKLIPVREKDWGLQAFRMPGDGAKGQVFVHAKGTFGIASAAYWWQRVAAGVVRLAHAVGGRALAVLHLLFAVDGWLCFGGATLLEAAAVLVLRAGPDGGADELEEGKGRRHGAVDRAAGCGGL